MRVLVAGFFEEYKDSLRALPFSIWIFSSDVILYFLLCATSPTFVDLCEDFDSLSITSWLRIAFVTSYFEKVKEVLIHGYSVSSRFLSTIVMSVISKVAY